MANSEWRIAICTSPYAICNLLVSAYNARRQRGVAQLVARSVRDAEADGSSPFAPTKQTADDFSSAVFYAGLVSPLRQPLCRLVVAIFHIYIDFVGYFYVFRIDLWSLFDVY